MSDEDKGVKVFSPNLDLLKWVKESTHYPEIKPIYGTVYSPWFASTSAARSGD